MGYKFLLIDESAGKQRMQELKSLLNARHITKITSETEEITFLPEVNWSEFAQCHLALFKSLHCINQDEPVGLYWCDGLARSTMHELKYLEICRAYFELDADDLAAHIEKLSDFRTVYELTEFAAGGIAASIMHMEALLQAVPVSQRKYENHLQHLYVKTQLQATAYAKLLEQMLHEYREYISMPWKDVLTEVA